MAVMGAKPMQPGQMNPGPDISGLDRRLKMLEERFTNIRSKIQLTEQNMLQKNRTFFGEIKTANMELTEIKKEVAEIKDRMLSLAKDMEGLARKENVEVLKRYIDIWNPVNFVSKNEIEDIIKEVIEKLRP